MATGPAVLDDRAPPNPVAPRQGPLDCRGPTAQDDRRRGPLDGRPGSIAVRAFGDRVVESIARPTGWPELCAAALAAEGRDVPHDRVELLKAAFSTTSMPNALGTAVEKVALDVFTEMSSTWMNIARIVDASDFKDGKAIRLSAAAKFEKLGKTGEIKHGDLLEDSFTYRVDTYAKMFGLTRQDIINDDASILSDLPIVLGSEGARSVSDLFFEVLIGNAGSYYSAGNGNLLTGAGSALSIEGMADAIKTLRTRTDRDGRLIGFTPATLLVPAALEATALQLLNSAQVYRDTGGDTAANGNPYATLGAEARR